MAPPSKKDSPGRRLCVDLLRLATAVAEGRRKPADIAKELQRMANWVAEIVPREPAKPGPDTKAQEDEIFAYWLTASGKTGAKFSPERREKVRTRLRDGYSVAAIKQAIDHVCSDPWHTGSNPSGKTYVDLTLICRNGSKLESYIDAAGGAATVVEPANDGGKQAQLTALKLEAKRALDKGDNDGYDRAQQAIRRLRTG